MCAPSIHILRPNSSLIEATARTVTLAFKSDPLIAWLRPGEASRQIPDNDLQKWQYRRVQNARAAGDVFILEDKSLNDRSPSSRNVKAVGLLFQEGPSLRYYISRACALFSVFCRDRIWPVQDRYVDSNRLQVMFEMHNEAMNLLKKSTSKPLWYIEVVAVDPSFHGQGLGAQMLQHMIDHCPPNAVIYLEATQRKTVGFYEKFGFSIWKEVVLRDPIVENGESVALFVMRRG